MSIKDILVHLDGDTTDGAAVTAAVGLAKRCGARLTGLFARTEIHGPALVARRPSEALLAAAATAAATFAAQAGPAGIDTRWWEIHHGGPGELVAEMVFCSHYVDLVVMSAQAARGQHVPDILAEQLILKSGRPLLVVPDGGAYADVGRRVVIGWLPGMEAARALQAALPLITDAASVLVASVGGQGMADDDQPRVDIVDHLQRHGLPVTGERLTTEGLKVMDQLLSRAYDIEADLLVMGAHAGYSLPGARIGAGTRHVIAHAQVPVLFSA